MLKRRTAAAPGSNTSRFERPRAVRRSRSGATHSLAALRRGRRPRHSEPQTITMPLMGMQARRARLPVKVGRLVTCALLLTLVPGCTSGHLSQPAPSPSTGHVRGQLLFVGGPAPGSARPLSGTVTLSGLVQMNVTVGLRGHYFATLPPGVYRVEGLSPQFGSGTYPCHAQARVTVGPNETAQADVYCQGK